MHTTCMWWHFVQDEYKLGAGRADAASLVAPSPCIQPQSIAEIVIKESTYSTPMQAGENTHVSLGMLSHCHRAATQGSQAFALWDLDAGFTSFSDNWAAVTGMETQYCEGFTLIHLVDAQDQYHFHLALEAARKEKQHLRIQLGMPDDAPRTMECECLPPTNETPHVLVLMRDSTAQTELEHELQRTQHALQHATHSRSAFLSCMSHELRTPLNAIIGFASMMRDEVLGKMKHDGYSEYAHHIHDSGHNLLQRISDLLEIAAIDAGGVALDEEEICLDALSEAIIEMHSHSLFAKDITLNTHTHGMRVIADKRKLLCIINHLLGNALNHSKAGSSLQLYSSITADGALTLSLRDYGAGMKAEKLATIREALASNVSYAHIQEEGIGLGLSLSKEIMVQHQGSLSIDGSRLEGTIVNMHFPAGRVPAAAQHPRLVKS